MVEVFCRDLALGRVELQACDLICRNDVFYISGYNVSLSFQTEII